MKNGGRIYQLFHRIIQITQCSTFKELRTCVKTSQGREMWIFVGLSTQFEVSLQQNADNIVIKLVKLIVGKSFFEKIISGSYGFGQNWLYFMNPNTHRVQEMW